MGPPSSDFKTLLLFEDEGGEVADNAGQLRLA